ncbi:MAG TPA: hypothetical protein VE662_01420 [Solirubrobacterales bacterium]|nr:hypothetical protein [Solirubrobacterales bacterium]
MPKLITVERRAATTELATTVGQNRTGAAAIDSVPTGDVSVRTLDALVRDLLMGRRADIPPGGQEPGLLELARRHVHVEGSPVGCADRERQSLVRLQAFLDLRLVAPGFVALGVGLDCPTGRDEHGQEDA